MWFLTQESLCLLNLVLLTQFDLAYCMGGGYPITGDPILISEQWAVIGSSLFYLDISSVFIEVLSFQDKPSVLGGSHLKYLKMFTEFALGSLAWCRASCGGISPALWFPSHLAFLFKSQIGYVLSFWENNQLAQGIIHPCLCFWITVLRAMVSQTELLSYNP